MAEKVYTRGVENICALLCSQLLEQEGWCLLVPNSKLITPIAWFRCQG